MRVQSSFFSVRCWLGPCLALLLLATACAPKDESPHKLRVFVSILPQAFFAERIGDGRVQVDVLVQPGQSAEMYQPTPRQMAALGEADLYLRIGMPFEDVWMDRIRAANARLKIVDVTEGIARRTMEAHVDEDEDAHENGAHEHGAHAQEGLKDPHVWLDPIRAKQLAARTARALADADPAGRAVYEANLARLDTDLDQLDRELRQTLSGLKDRRFMVYHPALGYFADRYGLRQIPIQIEGKDPTARTLTELINLARRDGIRVIFVQKQFSSRSAQTVAQAIGGRVEPADDLSRDYLNNLRRLAQTIAQADRERK